MIEYFTFLSWAVLLEYIAGGGRVAYQAPLDYRPRIVHVVKVFKNGKIRLDPLSNEADTFTADEKHLDRFRMVKRAD